MKVKNVKPGQRWMLGTDAEDNPVQAAYVKLENGYSLCYKGSCLDEVLTKQGKIYGPDFVGAFGLTMENWAEGVDYYPLYGICITAQHKLISLRGRQCRIKIETID